MLALRRELFRLENCKTYSPIPGSRRGWRVNRTLKWPKGCLGKARGAKPGQIGVSHTSLYPRLSAITLVLATTTSIPRDLGPGVPGGHPG